MYSENESWHTVNSGNIGEFATQKVYTQFQFWMLTTTLNVRPSDSTQFINTRTRNYVDSFLSNFFFFRCEMHAIDYTVTAIETPPNSWLSINVYFVFYKINIPSTLSTRTFSQINKIITSNQTDKKTHPVELMFGWVWKW